MLDVSHRDYSVERSINFESASLSFKMVLRVFQLMVLCPQQKRLQSASNRQIATNESHFILLF